MRVVTNVCDTRPLTIPIGRLSENSVTELAFDLTPWVEEYGEGVAAILLMRPTESNASPVLTEMDGNIAYHTVTNGDLQYTGEGKVEITYTIGTKLKKGKIYKTRVVEALESSGTAPSPWQSWVDSVTAAAATAVTAKTAAVAAQEAAEDAQDAAEDAQSAAETAQAGAETAKTTAQTAATNASNSASAAATSASNAATSETNASSYATAASGSATAAASSASAAATSADEAEEASEHYPYIGTNGNWYVWDVDEEQFVDTGTCAMGDINFASFIIDPTTGMLSCNWTKETSEIVFSLNSSGYLEVTI